MASLSFTKMHGTGNDFIIVDNRDKPWRVDDIIAHTPELCHRRYGIGADGIICLQPPTDAFLDYTMIYRNADGSNAGMCGNGARCLALYAARAGLGNHLSFNVHDKVYHAEVKNDPPFVTVSFPVQTKVNEISPDDLPTLFQVNTGTEHVVLECRASELENEDKLRQLGQKIRHHPGFDPLGTNVNFMHGRSAREVQLQTYERGVEDLTLACGTGAMATALSWHHLNRGEKPGEAIKVEVKGGTLQVDFNYNPDTEIYSAIRLSGEASFVFEGTYAL